jgi:hypothetical protein
MPCGYDQIFNKQKKKKKRKERKEKNGLPFFPVHENKSISCFWVRELMAKNRRSAASRLVLSTSICFILARSEQKGELESKG